VREQRGLEAESPAPHVAPLSLRRAPELGEHFRQGRVGLGSPADKDDGQFACHDLVDPVQIRRPAVGYLERDGVGPHNRQAASRQVFGQSVCALRILMRTVFGCDHQNRGWALIADRRQRHEPT